MKKLLKLSVFALLAVFGAFAVAAIAPSLAYAHDEEAEVTQAEETEDGASEDQDDAYVFTAQPGDSYSKIARKAVQISGIENNVDLNQAEIVAAETFLTSHAGFPSIAAGEEISISKEEVKEAVDRAEDMEKSEEQRWEKYVPFVDFNTDNVGEAS